MKRIIEGKNKNQSKNILEKDQINPNIGYIYFMTKRDLFGYLCGPLQP
tara:strand:+ start:263 stop:406 length:144 start_codon:yes stop_codon:yes gene_type:complete